MNPTHSFALAESIPSGNGPSEDAYLIKGCGVSIICYSLRSIYEWVDEILAKGGVPTVSRYEEVL